MVRLSARMVSGLSCYWHRPRPKSQESECLVAPSAQSQTRSGEVGTPDTSQAFLCISSGQDRRGPLTDNLMLFWVPLQHHKSLSPDKEIPVDTDRFL